jgi:glucosyl-dolichyl phosphate glucuronosyltransferase
MLDISVVICAYTEKRRDDLAAAVESVRRQSIPPCEIIVVIDHNPALWIWARAHMPDVIVMKNRHERGLSGARNTGAAAARGAIVAFLDDDAVAAPDWLVRLGKWYTDPQILGVGGKIEPMWSSGKPGWFPEEFNWVVGCSYRGLPDQSARVRNLIGANMSFRREVFTEAGGVRAEMGRVGTNGAGCEETELCIRLGQQWPEHILLFDPNARVKHRVPSNRAHWGYFWSRCFAEGRSKAVVSQYVGAKDGLTSEASYTLRTLPRGVARRISKILRYRDPIHMGQAAAIIAGFTITALGYVTGTLATRSSFPLRSKSPVAEKEPAL